jgi:hypothetical protein
MQFKGHHHEVMRTGLQLSLPLDFSILRHCFLGSLQILCGPLREGNYVESSGLVDVLALQWFLSLYNQRMGSCDTDAC